MYVTYQWVLKSKSDIQHTSLCHLSKKRLNCSRQKLCMKVTIVVYVAVKDVATSYKYTQFKHANFKLQKSIYIFD